MCQHCKKLVDISTSLWYTVEVVMSTFAVKEYIFNVRQI